MPVQRTREEENKLEAEVLENGLAVTTEALRSLERLGDKLEKLQNPKPESKK